MLCYFSMMTNNSFSTFKKIKDAALRISGKPAIKKTAHILCIVFFVYTLLGMIVIPGAAKIVIVWKGPQIIHHPVKVRGIYFNPFTFSLGAREIHIIGKDQKPMAGFNRLAVNFQVSSLWRDAWHLKEVDINGLYADITLLKDGTINLAALAQQNPPAQPAPEQKPPAAKKDKFVLINNISFTNGAVSFNDEKNVTPFAYTIAPINFKMDNVSTKVDDSHVMKLTLLIPPSGKIEMSSQCNINPLQCVLWTRVDNLALSAFQAYASDYTLVKIADGSFNLDMAVIYKALEGGNSTVRVGGGTSITNLALLDNRTNTPLAGWKEFSLKGIDFNVYANTAVVGHVLLDGLTVDAVLEKDQQVNFAKLIKQQPAAQPAAGVSTESKPTPAKPLSVHVGLVEFKNGNVQFNDQSVSPEFKVALSDMEAHVKNASNAVDNQIDFDFSTGLDDKGLISVEGYASPFSASTPAQVSCKIEQYDMTALTPYMAKFLGFEVAEGTFNLDISYDYSKEKLVGNHEVLMNKFTLGKPVDSPDALKVPIKLAIAILEDINRRIDLALPVKGTPNDPSFQLSGLIMKTLTNLMTKVVLSPFSLLSGVVGEGEEDIGVIAFDPGSSALSEDEKKKLLRLIKSLSVRPRISIEVKGYVDPSGDGWVVKEAGFDQQVDLLMKENKKFRNDTLKKLYVKDYGLRKMWALSKQYKSKTVSDEMAQQMRQELIATYKIEDAVLDQMAKSRAQAIYDVLIAAGGIPAERVTLSETFEKTTVENNRIPNKLTFSVKDHEDLNHGADSTPPNGE